MERSYWYVFSMIRNSHSSSGDRMIKNIMASCCVIEQEAILFQKLNEFTRSKPGNLRHGKIFLWGNSGSPVRQR